VFSGNPIITTTTLPPSWLVIHTIAVSSQIPFSTHVDVDQDAASVRRRERLWG
jgi:hypothetical protein